MKISTRAALLTAAALAVAGLQAVPATAGDARGPVCSDIISGSVIYKTDQDPSSASLGKGVVTTNSDLAAPSCTEWNYTVYVLDQSGTTTLASQSIQGDGSQVLAHRMVLEGDPVLPPQTVCVYGETSRNGRAADRVPDTGCVEAKLDKPPGGQNWS